MNGLKEFKQYSQQVHQHPTTDNVHELRKITRKFRSIMKFHKLDKLSRILGKQRDLDVAILNARHYHLKTKKIKNLRNEQRRKTKTFLTNKKIKKLTLAIQNEKAFPDGVDSSLTSLQKSLNHWKKKKIKKNDLHKLRIFIKKVRYTYEELERPVTVLKRLQNDLGQIHDLDVLEELLGRNKNVHLQRKAMIKKTMESALKTLSRLKISGISSMA